MILCYHLKKYMDLDKSTIRVASLVLKYMGHHQVEKLDKVLSYVENKTGDGISENFLSAPDCVVRFR